MHVCKYQTDVPGELSALDTQLTQNQIHDWEMDIQQTGSLHAYTRGHLTCSSMWWVAAMNAVSWLFSHVKFFSWLLAQRRHASSVVSILHVSVQWWNIYKNFKQCYMYKCYNWWEADIWIYDQYTCIDFLQAFPYQIHTIWTALKQRWQAVLHT